MSLGAIVSHSARILRGRDGFGFGARFQPVSTPPVPPEGRAWHRPALSAPLFRTDPLRDRMQAPIEMMTNVKIPVDGALGEGDMGKNGIIVSFIGEKGSNQIVPGNGAFRWEPVSTATHSVSKDDASVVLLTKPGVYSVTFHAPVSRGSVLGIEVDGMIVDCELAGVALCPFGLPLRRRVRTIEMTRHVTVPETASVEAPTRLRIVNLSRCPIRSGERLVSGVQLAPKLGIVHVQALTRPQGAHV